MIRVSLAYFHYFILEEKRENKTEATNGLIRLKAVFLY